MSRRCARARQQRRFRAGPGRDGAWTAGRGGCSRLVLDAHPRNAELVALASQRRTATLPAHSRRLRCGRAELRVIARAHRGHQGQHRRAGRTFSCIGLRCTCSRAASHAIKTCRRLLPRCVPKERNTERGFVRMTGDCPDFSARMSASTSASAQPLGARTAVGRSGSAGGENLSDKFSGCSPGYAGWNSLARVARFRGVSRALWGVARNSVAAAESTESDFFEGSSRKVVSGSDLLTHNDTWTDERRRATRHFHNKGSKLEWTRTSQGLAGQIPRELAERSQPHRIERHCSV